MDEEAVVAKRVRAAKRGYVLTLVLFWGWLLVGIADPFNNLHVWYAIYAGLAVLNVIYIIRRSVAEDGWRMGELIPDP